ncbi:hypothetical protein [Streptomyces sp. NPDC001880]
MSPAHTAPRTSTTPPETTSRVQRRAGADPERGYRQGARPGGSRGARGRGIASFLLKRAWQVYDLLDYFLLYGSFETDRDLGAFYKGCGYAVHAPDEGFLLERINLPFGIHAGPDQCVFTRWRSPR